MKSFAWLSPKNVDRHLYFHCLNMELNLKQLKEGPKSRTNIHTDICMNKHTYTFKHTRTNSKCGSQATVGPVASCRDTGMKIEPIGNAGALEMCSLGHMTSTTVAVSSLSITLTIPFPPSYTCRPPHQSSVITTNQFAQNLHKASGQKRKHKKRIKEYKNRWKYRMANGEWNTAAVCGNVAYHSGCDMDTRMPMLECSIELHSIRVKTLHLVCMPRPRAHFHVTNAC